MVPDSLKVGRLSARAGAGDQQAAAVLGVQRHQARIKGAELADPLVLRHLPRRFGR